MQIAQHNAALLISGEPGSGRQLFARYIHQHSLRRAGPFITVDLSAPAEQQLQVLFGSERNDLVQYGELEKAHGGSLYLRDIAELGDEGQRRLHEWLSSGRFCREGGANPINVDTRLIVATRQPLDEWVAQGRFHEGLYYQLNILALMVPALREHSEDVLDLVSYYCDYYVEADKLPYRSFTTAALNRLRQYSWPGNVRELKNLVQRLLIIGQERQIELAEVDEALARQPRLSSCDNSDMFEQPLRQAREQFEQAYFEHLLRRYQGSVNKVAQHAEVERTHLYRKLRSLSVDPKDYM